MDVKLKHILNFSAAEFLHSASAPPARSATSAATPSSGWARLRAGYLVSDQTFKRHRFFEPGQPESGKRQLCYFRSLLEREVGQHLPWLALNTAKDVDNYFSKIIFSSLDLFFKLLNLSCFKFDQMRLKQIKKCNSYSLPKSFFYFISFWPGRLTRNNLGSYCIDFILKTEIKAIISMPELKWKVNIKITPVIIEKSFL